MKIISNSVLKYFVCLALFVTPVTILSQIDSNHASLYKNLNGAERIDSLNSYTTKLISENSELKFILAKECLMLSEKENYIIGKINALNNIGLIFKNNNKYSSFFYFKQAFDLAKKNNNYNWIVTTATNTGESLSDSQKFDSSIVYYRKGMAYAVKLKDSVSIARLFNLLGFTQWRKGSFNQAIKYFKESLIVQKQLGQNQKAVKVLNNIGTSYFHLENYEIALDYYLEAIELRKSFDSTFSPILLNNIGLIYLKLNDTQLANNYFRRALMGALVSNHKLGIGYSYLNIGDLDFQTARYDSALVYYTKSKKLYNEINDINGVVKISYKIRQVYLKTNQFNLAKQYFLDAYGKSKRLGLKLTQTESLVNFCKIQIKQGLDKRAIANLKKALKLANSEKFVDIKLEILKLQSQVHENLHKFEDALKFNHKYETLKDSLYNEKSLRIIINAKEKYEAEVKEKRYNHLKRTNEIQRQELKNEKTENLYIITIAFFSFFVIIYLIYTNLQRKKQNIALEKAKAEVDIVNSKLNKTNKLLKKLNSTKDKFFSIIAHDLKNPFNTLLGASQILSMNDGSLTEDEKTELIQIIANDSQKLNNLLENLLFWARSQTGKVKLKKTKIELNNIISEITHLYESSLKNKNISIILDIPDNLTIYFDEFMFSTIVRNLLSNAIKFSYDDSKITLRAVEKEEKIIFSVIDEGTGISEENIKKLFDEGSNYKSAGTNNEKGTGLGLILCRDFANENDSTISVSSVLDKGTTFELVLQKG